MKDIVERVSKIKILPQFVLKYKFIIIPAVVILLLAVNFLLPKNTIVLTETVNDREISRVISVTGEVDAVNKVNLSFQTSEILSWVGVKEGDVVQQWQAIASLNQSKLRASLRQAQADLAAAQATSDEYLKDHNPNDESYEERITRTSIDAKLINAREQIQKIEYDLAHSTLYTPIAGVVTRADVQTAGVAVSSTTVFTVTDPTSLIFKMEIDETDVGQIREGQLVRVTFDAFPDTVLDLSIESIDLVSHKTSSGSNAFYVKAAINNPQLYRIGMVGNADIIIDSKQHAMSVPYTSVQDGYVFVLDNNKFRKTKVQTGIEGDTYVEVIAGLKKGDTVALDPDSIPQQQLFK